MRWRGVKFRIFISWIFLARPGANTRSEIPVSPIPTAPVGIKNFTLAQWEAKFLICEFFHTVPIGSPFGKTNKRLKRGGTEKMTAGQRK